MHSRVGVHPGSLGPSLAGGHDRGRIAAYDSERYSLVEPFGLALVAGLCGDQFTELPEKQGGRRSERPGSLYGHRLERPQYTNGCRSDYWPFGTSLQKALRDNKFLGTSFQKALRAL